MAGAAAKNPFEVLGLPPTASARQIEREAQRRLAMIAAGVADDCSADAEHDIRQALDELRDGEQRLLHEILSPSLGRDVLARIPLEPHVETLAAALPPATPTTFGLAEELLWRALRWPAPYVLPEGHEEERARVFEARAGEPAPTLKGALDYSELVAFRPPTKPSLRSKAQAPKAPR
jgi:hypothetical protein